MDLTTAQGVTEYMSKATSESDWNNRCDKVKEANGGYPEFWFAIIQLSGLANEVVSSWKRDGK